MGSPKSAVSGDVDAAEAERIVQEWLAPSALARIKLREKYAHNPNPRQYLAELRALPELKKEAAELECLLPGEKKSGSQCDRALRDRF